MAHEQREDAETLRLIKAFSQVKDRKARQIILAVVEAAARGALVNIEEPAELGLAVTDWSSAGENTQH
jgi:hypothetical protein